MKFARLFLIGISLICTVRCCTNVLVTPSATINNEAIIAYNADDLSLEGKFYHYPSRDTSPGDLRKIWDWDSGVYLGEIPEFDEGRTYNVIGNTNEFLDSQLQKALLEGFQSWLTINSQNLLLIMAL